LGANSSLDLHVMAGRLGQGGNCATNDCQWN